jgi:hypothetical protein
MDSLGIRVSAPLRPNFVVPSLAEAEASAGGQAIINFSAQNERETGAGSSADRAGGFGPGTTMRCGTRVTCRPNVTWFSAVSALADRQVDHGFGLLVALT